MVVEPGQTVELGLELPQLASISGFVVDDSRAPVADAWVVATMPGARHINPASDPVMSDTSGYFTIPDLGEATYDVVASSTRGEAWARTVAAGDERVVLRIADHGYMTGTVEGARGERADSFLLRYRRAEDGAISSQRGYAGTWRLDWLAPGHYELVASSALGCAIENVTLSPGSEIDVALSVSPRDGSCEPRPERSGGQR